MRRNNVREAVGKLWKRRNHLNLWFASGRTQFEKRKNCGPRKNAAWMLEAIPSSPKKFNSLVCVLKLCIYNCKVLQNVSPFLKAWLSSWNLASAVHSIENNLCTHRVCEYKMLTGHFVGVNCYRLSFIVQEKMNQLNCCMLFFFNLKNKQCQQQQQKPLKPQHRLFESRMFLSNACFGIKHYLRLRMPFTNVINNSQIRCNRFAFKQHTDISVKLPIQLCGNEIETRWIRLQCAFKVTEKTMHQRVKWLKPNKKFNRFVSCGHKLWKCGTMLYILYVCLRSFDAIQNTLGFFSFVIYIYTNWKQN